MRALLFLLLLTMAAPADRRDDLRRYALAAPKQAERSLPALAEYLQRPARTETEKAFVTYCWVVSRLRYEKAGADQSPARVFAKRRGVCEGYSRLYSDLVGRMGLECYHISGLARAGGEPMKRDHVWDVLYADGSWRLVDTTWAANPEDESCFFVDPARFLATHFPHVERWQLLSPPRTKAEFLQNPRVTDAAYRLKVRPLSHPRIDVVTRGPLKLQFSAPDYVRLSTEDGRPLPRNTLRLDLPKGRHEVSILATTVKADNPQLVLVYRVHVKP